MKKISIIFLLVFFIAGSGLYAQKITTDKVPGPVAATFRAKFPGSQQQTWNKVENNAYRVMFFNGKKPMAATFDEAGKWIKTETEINANQLPKAVNQGLYKEFEGFNVQQVYQVETADKGTLYDVTIMKGRENYEVRFSAKGEVLSKVAGESGENE